MVLQQCWGVTVDQEKHNSSNVGGVTAGQEKHNSSNVGGVTAGQARHNSSNVGVSLRARWDTTLVHRIQLFSHSSNIYCSDNKCHNNCSKQGSRQGRNNSKTGEAHININFIENLCRSTWQILCSHEGRENMAL